MRYERIHRFCARVCFLTRIYVSSSFRFHRPNASVRACTHYSSRCPVNRKCTVCSWSLVPSSSACEDPLCTDLLRKSLQFEISRKDIRREIIASLATLVSLERSMKTRHYDTMQVATSSRTHNFC